jgi:hypothetical protein
MEFSDSFEQLGRGVRFKRYPTAPLQTDSKIFSSSSQTVSIRIFVEGYFSFKNRAPRFPPI